MCVTCFKIIVCKTENEDGTTAKQSKGPAHGDELAYIFEPLDAEGQPLGGEISQTDAHVRHSFVDLIAKFAHDLNPVDNKTNSKMPVLPFSKDNDQFIKIDKEVTLEKDFR